MQTNIITSEKALMRAIASAFVNDKKETEKILKKYGVKDTSLHTVLLQLSENRKFATDFTNLMIKKKYLRNAKG